MKIIQLKTENVKKLMAIEITPDGKPVVIVSGKNGAGKSAVLDSITYAMAGSRSFCERPVREGAEKATIVCTVDDLVVKRTITRDGKTTLVVSSRDGKAKYNSPQSILDALTNALSFDPQAFSRMEDQKALAVIKNLVGLDFSGLDAERKSLYDQRTESNREVTRLKAQLQQLPEEADVPEEEVSVSALFSKLDAIRTAKKAFEDEQKNLDGITLQIQVLYQQVDQWTEWIEKATKEADGLRGKADSIEAGLNRFVIEDENPISEQIKTADETNRKVRAARQRRDVKTSLESEETVAGSLTKSIEEIDRVKSAMMAAAEFPVKGLSFNDHGVLYSGIPFSQCSSGEKLRVSLAMGFAMRPDLRVLLIRDGSLLDAENLKVCAEMAEANDGQVWIEKVSDDDQVTVQIEDGSSARASEGQS